VLDQYFSLIKIDNMLKVCHKLLNIQGKN